MDVVKRAWLWVCAPPIPLLIAMLIFGIALGGSLHSVEFRSAQSCVEQASIARAAGEPVFDCTWGDFLERWQGLVGSMIALGAAAIAAVPLYQQLREMNRQSQAVAVERLTRVVQSLEQEYRRTRELRTIPLRHLRSLEREARQGQVPHLADPQQNQLAQAVSELFSEIEKHKMRNPQSSILSNARLSVFEDCAYLAKVIKSAAKTTKEVSKLGALSITRPGVDASDIRQSLASLFANFKAYDQVLSTDIERHWRKIRQLEELAVAM